MFKSTIANCQLSGLHWPQRVADGEGKPVHDRPVVVSHVEAVAEAVDAEIRKDDDWGEQRRADGDLVDVVSVVFRLRSLAGVEKRAQVEQLMQWPVPAVVVVEHDTARCRRGWKLKQMSAAVTKDR